MNVYRMIGHKVGTPEARELAERLSLWHDAMVAHERATVRAGTSCDEECPHAEAVSLWQEASTTLAARAEELNFLQSRALGEKTARTESVGRSQSS